MLELEEAQTAWIQPTSASGEFEFGANTAAIGGSSLDFRLYPYSIIAVGAQQHLAQTSALTAQSDDTITSANSNRLIRAAAEMSARRHGRSRHSSDLVKILESIRENYLRRHEIALKANRDTNTPSHSKTAYSDQQIHRVAESGRDNIARWATLVASTRGVRLRRRSSHTFAIAVSRLSDAEVDLDSVEEILIALGQAGVITAFQRGLLQVGYLR
ncbi:MAG: hypothetical protein HIU91_04030 [Acidobacteria bacterium]|nr:hypothetical protein [Acidobacteriota bacterium]